jgi:hypothetical protein
MQHENGQQEGETSEAYQSRIYMTSFATAMGNAQSAADEKRTKHKRMANRLSKCIEPFTRDRVFRYCGHLATTTAGASAIALAAAVEDKMPFEIVGEFQAKMADVEGTLTLQSLITVLISLSTTTPQEQLTAERTTLNNLLRTGRGDGKGKDVGQWIREAALSVRVIKQLEKIVDGEQDAPLMSVAEIRIPAFLSQSFSTTYLQRWNATSHGDVGTLHELEAAIVTFEKGTAANNEQFLELFKQASQNFHVNERESPHNPTHPLSRDGKRSRDHNTQQNLKIHGVNSSEPSAEFSDSSAERRTFDEKDCDVIRVNGSEYCDEKYHKIGKNTDISRETIRRNMGTSGTGAQRTETHSTQSNAHAHVDGSFFNAHSQHVNNIQHTPRYFNPQHELQQGHMFTVNNPHNQQYTDQNACANSNLQNQFINGNSSYPTLNHSDNFNRAVCVQTIQHTQPQHIQHQHAHVHTPQTNASNSCAACHTAQLSTPQPSQFHICNVGATPSTPPTSFGACFSCGKQGHMSRACPERECFRCHAKGHTAHNCPQTQNNHPEQPNSQFSHHTHPYQRDKSYNGRGGRGGHRGGMRGGGRGGATSNRNTPRTDTDRNQHDIHPDRRRLRGGGNPQARVACRDFATERGCHRDNCYFRHE